MSTAMPDSANHAVIRGENAPDEAGHAKPSVFHPGQLVIRNEGSTTRDYLAYERNYLAWVKLCISCMVISGALLLRLHINENRNQNPVTSLEDQFAKPVGIIFFGMSLLALLAATLSFFTTQRDLLRNMGHVSSGKFTEAVSLFCTAVIGASCVLLMISAEQTSQP